MVYQEGQMESIRNILAGKKGLIVGIANENSIAYGCASVLRDLGAEFAVTYLNQKAEKYVRPLADQLGSPLVLPLDVEQPGQMEAVFEAIRQQWGKLDFVIHSIAFCPMDDLHGRVTDCSQAGFQQAMRVSCYSFIEMARLAEPLMIQGGSLITMSYYGADKVVENYNIMGPVKAALESVSRYLASELGPKNIRVHAVSPGPLRTRAASGIAHFDQLIEDAIARAPQNRLVEIEDVGTTCAFLISEAARGLTGQTIYVDGGHHIKA
ncbi:enoyl-[acyl-carrier-protein] reductase [NADH] [Chromobacterium haemolyticum]|nr:enoyl-ACP reductase FabI [Chromobacterium haemolyticum]BBH11381.1 enoyl-[acyl-carrier-protein] reductase [NADH] [Chromobacterium haemolyticum]